MSEQHLRKRLDQLASQANWESKTGIQLVKWDAALERLLGEELDGAPRDDLLRQAYDLLWLASEALAAPKKERGHVKRALEKFLELPPIGQA